MTTRRAKQSTNNEPLANASWKKITIFISKTENIRFFTEMKFQYYYYYYYDYDYDDYNDDDYYYYYDVFLLYRFVHSNLRKRLEIEKVGKLIFLFKANNQSRPLSNFIYHSSTVCVVYCKYAWSCHSFGIRMSVYSNSIEDFLSSFIFC